MKANLWKVVGFLLLLVVVALGYFEVSTDTQPEENGARPASVPAPTPPAAAGSRVQAPPSDGVLRIVESVSIKNYDKVVYRGTVDLSVTIERIRSGIKFPHRNDGSVFGNRERLLPSKPRGYYREYVHPTEGLKGPGPQRVVVGRDGDWWYTPDHYASFIELGKESGSEREPDLARPVPVCRRGG